MAAHGDESPTCKTNARRHVAHVHVIVQQKNSSETGKSLKKAVNLSQTETRQHALQDKYINPFTGYGFKKS